MTPRECKVEYPRFFDCPHLGNTFKALNEQEAENAISMGASEVNEFIYDELNKAYKAGHETPLRRKARTAKCENHDG